jgi:hypothetical protein
VDALLLIVVWGFSVVADSAQFSALVSEYAPRDHVGTALTLQTCVGFLLTMVTIELLPRVAGATSWQMGIALARARSSTGCLCNETPDCLTPELPDDLTNADPYTKRTFSNGLDVIVHEDHQLPMVAVNVWYHVGSKNERPGRTGFAHLFEHLMFEGSEHHDHGYFPPLQRAGGLLNGSTNVDRTNYWEVVPTGALDLALWMESDRMGYLLPALTDQKFNNQRDVVLNERRQNYENRPYGLAGVAMSAAMYPPDHPYHWPTIGSAEDIRAARLDDVREFFQTYYHAGNASLSLAGDVDTGRRSNSLKNISAACLPVRRWIASASMRG